MSTQTMIDAAVAVPSSLDDAHAAPVLGAALTAFADELEALATSTLAANKRGAKGRSTIYTECAAMLRGRAAEFETHGPISDAQARRAAALAETEAGAARLLEGARPNENDMINIKALVGMPQTESTALEVEQSDVCGIRDEMGYECERKPHPPGNGPHEMYRPDGEVSARWPDARPVSPPPSAQVEIAEYLTGKRDDLPVLDAAPVLDLGPISPDVAAIVRAATEPDYAREVITDMIDPFRAPDPDYAAESLWHMDPDAMHFEPQGVQMPEPGEMTVTWDGDGVFNLALPAEDPFATVEPVSAAPWRLPPAPRPFAFDPSTSNGVPDHVSYSQITTGEACGLQLRLKKRDGVKGQPALWNVGGTAFHACVELIEGVRIGRHATSETMAGVLDGELGSCAALFVHNFDSELTAAEFDSGLDRERFRVGGKGTENDAWWRHNGALMVRDYVAHSDAMRAEGWDILNIAGKMVGLELDLNTPIGHDLELNRPVMLNARMDVVWFRWEPASSTSPDGIPTLHLRVEDGKSGARPVTDTFQLGLYGHVLKRVISADFPPPVVEAMKISAAYYDARNGKSSEAFDPLAAHSWAEIEYRGLTTLGMHAAGIYPASPNAAYGGPCGLCDVRHTCPIMATRE